MMDGIYNQIMVGLETQYDLDVDQSEQIEILLRQRLDRFMYRHRPVIQQAMNEYFEALLNTEPPEISEVTDWSQRILPLVQEFGEEMQALSGGMAELMTEDQRGQLDTSMAGFRAGLDMATERLRVWSQGGYDPLTEWPDSREFEDAERARQAEARAAVEAARAEAQARAAEAQAHAARAAAEAERQRDAAQVVEVPLVEAPARGAPPRPAAGEPAPAASRPASAPASRPADEWTAYVEEFIRRYELNPEQTAQARRFLRQRQSQRDQILDRKSAEFARLSEQYREATSPEAFAQAESEYNRLMQPVDAQFDRLKKQLEALPTREQRRRAGEPDTGQGE